MMYYTRHRENFGAFTGPKGDFGLILLILNMIMHMSFTGPTQFLPVNVRGPVSFAVFVILCFTIHIASPVHARNSINNLLI